MNNVFKEFRPDCVFHLAAVSSLSSKDAQETKDVNIFGTSNVLEASVNSKAKRIIFSSSAAVYGNASKFPTDENQKLNPINEYGISKAKAESQIISSSKKYGLNYTILRLSNAYGPRQRYDNEGGVVSIFAHKIANNQPIIIYGNGHQTRDFVAVSDVVLANMLAVKKTDSLLCNISSKKSTSIERLARMIIETINPQYMQKIIYKNSLSCWILHSRLDNEKARHLLGWKPHLMLQSGLINLLHNSV